MKRVFISVGSTFFDELVDAALSEETLLALQTRGIDEVIVQCGAYKGKDDRILKFSSATCHLERHGLRVEIYSFKPSLTEDILKADLVISHAGSGTIIDVLRMGKPLIVVPNPSLLDNHQQDLAIELHKLDYLRTATPRTLHECVSTFKAEELRPFPPRVEGKFQSIIDDVMCSD